MSKKHPVVAVTGSSGAGTTTVKRAFEHIFFRDGINAAVVEGDSFHRYDRAAMRAKIEPKDNLSHFGPEANLFDKLARIVQDLRRDRLAAKNATTCTARKRPTSTMQRLGTNIDPGEFTPWERSSEAPTCCSTKACTAWP